MSQPAIIGLADRLATYELEAWDGLSRDLAIRPILEHSSGEVVLNDAAFASASTELVDWAMSNGFALEVLESELERDAEAWGLPIPDDAP